MILSGTSKIAYDFRQYGLMRGTICWALATLPGLALVYLGTDSFLSLLEMAGGAIGLIIGIGIVPVYRAVIKGQPESSKGVNLGFLESPICQIIIVAGFLLMAAGALL